MFGLLLVSSTAWATDVLFVGNSYTNNNNLPATVNAVFVAAELESSTDKLTGGGLTLADHASRASNPDSDWYTKLVVDADVREWVVLQDQSQVPGFPASEAMWIASREGAQALNDLVSDAGASTMFFLTWGYRSGDPMNEWMYGDFLAMQERLTAGYQAYAAATGMLARPVWIAPVGPAFAEVHANVVAAGLDPEEPGNDFYDLYAGDGSHPSRTGTQLAAYVFFASLTGQTPVGLPTPDGIDEDKARMLQDVAAGVVFNESDAFTFPWETDTDSDATDDDAEEDTDSSPAPEDTAPPADDAETGGTTPEEPSDETNDEQAGTDLSEPDPDADADADAENEEAKSAGCAVQGHPPGWFLMGLAALLIVSRRQSNSVD